MSRDRLQRSIRLPKGWKSQVRSAVVRVMSLAKFSVTQAYGPAAVAMSPRLRQQSEIARLKQEVLLQREELRIKDARMAQLPSHTGLSAGESGPRRGKRYRAAKPWTCAGRGAFSNP
jgi:hypothetical protein